MDELILEGIRCFRDEVRLPLRPLTLLVGENSSGKSTLLAAVRLAWSLQRGMHVPAFNEEPFNLGAYDDIAHFHGGHGQRARSFRLGCTSRGTAGFEGVFADKSGHPDFVEWSFAHLKGTDRLSASPQPSGDILFRGSDRGREFARTLAYGWFEGVRWDAQALLANVLRETRSEGDSTSGVDLLDLLWGVDVGARPVALAPVRSKPRRTYDPVRDDLDPEGSHVPMTLAARSLVDDDGWKRLHAELAAFGERSGLYKDLGVRRLTGKRNGGGPGDPFQVQITVGKRPFNLIDVGYGVSQVLPLLVDALLQQEGATFLIQQPEVHLHPRAQAELGAAFARISAARGQRFVVETHSDHLVDRIRLEVRAGTVRPTDVAIVWCERTNGIARIHPMTVDASGNLLGAPPGYRDFFVNHELTMLGAR